MAEVRAVAVREGSGLRARFAGAICGGVFLAMGVLVMLNVVYNYFVKGHTRRMVRAGVCDFPFDGAQALA
jgi:hypothetical protein